MNKIEKAILTELKEWDLTCSEEPSLKIELAKAIAKVVKNCSIPAVMHRAWNWCKVGLHNMKYTHQSLTHSKIKCSKCNAEWIEGEIGCLYRVK